MAALTSSSCSDDPSWETHLATPAEAAQVGAVKEEGRDALVSE